jgi:hypothetical protein
MVVQYQQLGVALNELNRSLGLLDVVPEVLTPVVQEKMRFIHQLIVLSKEDTLRQYPVIQQRAERTKITAKMDAPSETPAV